MSITPRLISGLVEGALILMLSDDDGEVVLRLAGDRTPPEPLIEIVAGVVFLVSGDGHLRVTAPDGRRLGFTYTGDPAVLLIGEHHAVCPTCSELWPCRHTRTDQTVRAFAREVDTLPEVAP